MIRRLSGAGATAAAITLVVAGGASPAQATNDVDFYLDTERFDWPHAFHGYIEEESAFSSDPLPLIDCTYPGSGSSAGAGKVKWCSFQTRTIPFLMLDDIYYFETPQTCETTNVTSPLGFSYPVRPQRLVILNGLVYPMSGGAQYSMIKGINYCERQLAQYNGIPSVWIDGTLRNPSSSKYELQAWFDTSRIPSEDDEKNTIAERDAALTSAKAELDDDCQRVTVGDGETFTGTPEADCVDVTVEADSDVSVSMLGGDDTVRVTVPEGSTAGISAGASDDVVIVEGDGIATVRGGHGNDTIIADSGDDTLTGGPGVDLAVGAGGTDDIDVSVEFNAPGTVKGLG